MPRRRGKRRAGEGHPTAPAQRRAADGGRCLQGPVLRCDLSAEQRLCEHRGERGEACTPTHSEDCCDTSRERENPEQSCLLGWQEKLVRSCTAHCLDMAPAAAPRGLRLSWVLSANGVCSSSGTSTWPGPDFFGPGKDSLSTPLLYSAPACRSPVHRANTTHGELP